MFGLMQVGAASDTNTVVTALKNAAEATGSDFHYLLGTAIRESSLKANAQSNTSSAGGLFQFLADLGGAVDVIHFEFQHGNLVAQTKQLLRG